MNRIDKKFKELALARKKALILFLTAGDPSLENNLKLVPALEKEGVDLIELGVPFSDPLADGPVIQAASLRSLERKTTLRKVLDLASGIRKVSQIPLTLMSYLNPITNFGLEKFAHEASLAGVDGLILPELPLEEGREIAAVLRRKKIHVIYFIAPTTSPERQKKIARASGGFIYYVSITGVTGSGHAMTGMVDRDVRAIQNLTRTPVCVGFGVSTPEQARAMSRRADGVIVGSALVKLLDSHAAMDAAAFAQKFVRPFVRAVKD